MPYIPIVDIASYKAPSLADAESSAVLNESDKFLMGRIGVDERERLGNDVLDPDTTPETLRELRNNGPSAKFP